MDVARARALGNVDEIFQNFGRGSSESFFASGLDFLRRHNSIGFGQQITHAIGVEHEPVQPGVEARKLHVKMAFLFRNGQ